MRGKGAQECRTSLISPKNSTLERRAVGVKPSAIQGKARLRGLARAVAHRGRFFGKPLRAISRFSHQDAQPPPSPLVGEGGWGDEGERRTGMQNIAHLSQKLYP
jgi:hypothetical protein